MISKANQFHTYLKIFYIFIIVELFMILFCCYSYRIFYMKKKISLIVIFGIYGYFVKKYRKKNHKKVFDFSHIFFIEMKGKNFILL